MRSDYIKAAIEYAWTLLRWKVPYKWAGNDEYVGVDCSGMIVAIFRRIGLISSRADYSSKMLYEKYSRYPSRPGPGCLVFYGKNLEHITHVAFMINRHQVIEAAGAGSECKTVEKAEELGARVRLNPHTYRTPLAIVDPFKSIV